VRPYQELRKFLPYMFLLTWRLQLLSRNGLYLVLLQRVRDKSVLVGVGFKPTPTKDSDYIWRGKGIFEKLPRPAVFDVGAHDGVPISKRMGIICSPR
jgi:hypothetical protein